MALLDITAFHYDKSRLLNYTHRLEPSEVVARLVSKVGPGKIFVALLDSTIAEIQEEQTRSAAEAMQAPNTDKGAKGPLSLVPTPQEDDLALNKDADLQWLNDTVAQLVAACSDEAYDTANVHGDVVDIGAKEGEPIIRVRVCVG